MNSPYGSFDHSPNSYGYDTGWESISPTDGDFGFSNDGFTTYAGDFTPFLGRSTWIPTSGAALTPSPAQQYDFSQGQQVWSVLETQIQRHPQQLSSMDDRGCNDAKSMYIPHNGAIVAAPPPLDGLSIAADNLCASPRSTSADHHSVALEDLQALFPSPTLPRKEPPCLYDNNGQPLQKQNPRFEGDLYAALWIRGEGISRAGWCGFCASWHKLKDSAYWYHLHYTHGIACHSGRPLDPPCKLRWSRSANALEAFCGTCEEWISIGKGVKVRTTYWRHAYRCSMKGKVRSPRRAAAMPDL